MALRMNRPVYITLGMSHGRVSICAYSLIRLQVDHSRTGPLSRDDNGTFQEQNNKSNKGDYYLYRDCLVYLHLRALSHIRGVLTGRFGRSPR
jgi:hypothetical protein